MGSHLIDEWAQIKVGSKVALYDIALDPIHAYVVRTMGIRMLSKKDLRELVLYSPAQIDRLEKVGRFPKRVRLGPCRVGWVEEEVLAWLETRLRAREIMTAPERSDPQRSE